MRDEVSFFKGGVQEFEMSITEEELQSLLGDLDEVEKQVTAYDNLSRDHDGRGIHPEARKILVSNFFKYAFQNPRGGELQELVKRTNMSKEQIGDWYTRYRSRIANPTVSSKSTALSEAAKQFLNQYQDEHQFVNPSEIQMKFLIDTLGLEKKQISNYFFRRRKK